MGGGRRRNGSPGPSERALWAGLEEDGFVCLPAGSSGSGTGGDRPDGLVGGGPPGLPVMAVEAKTTSKDAVTVEEAELEQLRAVAGGFGAEPVVAVYWKGGRGGSAYWGGWHFRHAEAVRRSPAENAGGGHHLRPRREDRGGWSDWPALLRGELPGYDAGRPPAHTPPPGSGAASAAGAGGEGGDRR
jgi:Holliday junction resolvase